MEKKEKKINKSELLKKQSEDIFDLDISSLLKKNMMENSSKCQHEISSQSFYCATCKLNLCPKCNLEEHKKHNLIKKDDYLFYNDDYFNNINESIKKKISIQINKESLIKLIEENNEKLHKQLNNIKEKKINEIKKISDDINLNINSLLNNFNNVKKEVKQYFIKNEKFFNITSNSYEYDTIFLMNFEFLNLINNKKFEILNSLNEINENYKSYNNYIESETQKISNNLSNYLEKIIPSFDFDDIFWDIKLRLKTYNEHIEKIQKNLFEIINIAGNMDDLVEIVSVLDSKSKKGVEYIFNQDFFKKQQLNDNSKTIDINEKRNKKNKKNNENNNIDNNKYNNNKNENNIDNNNNENKSNNNSNNNKNCIKKFKKELPKRNKNKTLIRSLSTNKNIHYNSDNHIKKKLFSSPQNKTTIMTSNSEIFNNNKNCIIPKKKTDIRKIFFTHSIDKLLINQNSSKKIDYHDLILDNNYKKRYFTYSIIDLYNKLFSKNPKRSLNSNNLILSDYNLRNVKLKEYAKPITGTNEILIYNPKINSSIKHKIKLEKDIIGYEKFPEGLRHILINEKLFICGGVDSLGNPISISCEFNILNFEFNKIENMNCQRAYHSIEFLECFDCLIVIGGQNNKTCEIYDLFTKKWIRIPDLNYCRANTNIYFDKFSSDVYAIFGMIGPVTKTKNNNIDIIEVIELNDINSGWFKVDYYKSNNLNLREEIVQIAPFTRDKLLIYGAKNNRFGNKLYALFLMDKNEIVIADENIRDEIKKEENKILKIRKEISKLVK